MVKSCYSIQSVSDSMWMSLPNSRTQTYAEHRRDDKLHGFGYLHMWKMKINGTSNAIQTAAGASRSGISYCFPDSTCHINRFNSVKSERASVCIVESFPDGSIVRVVVSHARMPVVRLHSFHFPFAEQIKISIFGRAGISQLCLMLTAVESNAECKYLFILERIYWSSHLMAASQRRWATHIGNAFFGRGIPIRLSIQSFRMTGPLRWYKCAQLPFSMQSVENDSQFVATIDHRWKTVRPHPTSSNAIYWWYIDFPLLDAFNVPCTFCFHHEYFINLCPLAVYNERRINPMRSHRRAPNIYYL